jgi:hypothetical protein
MGREARKGARVIACRSIEPEQSLGPCRGTELRHENAPIN